MHEKLSLIHIYRHLALDRLAHLNLVLVIVVYCLSVYLSVREAVTTAFLHIVQNVGCLLYTSVIPADVIDSFAEGVKGKHREGGEHRKHDALACFRGQTVQIAFEPCHQHFQMCIRDSQ